MLQGLHASPAGDEDQDRCGYYNADGQGARCCDNCQYDGSSGDAICCDKGAELCTNFEEPGGCCPAGEPPD